MPGFMRVEFPCVCHDFNSLIYKQFMVVFALVTYFPDCGLIFHCNYENSTTMAKSIEILEKFLVQFNKETNKSLKIKSVKAQKW